VKASRWLPEDNSPAAHWGRSANVAMNPIATRGAGRQNAPRGYIEAAGKLAFVLDSEGGVLRPYGVDEVQLLVFDLEHTIERIQPKTQAKLGTRTAMSRNRYKDENCLWANPNSLTRETFERAFRPRADIGHNVGDLRLQAGLDRAFETARVGGRSIRRPPRTIDRPGRGKQNRGARSLTEALPCAR
jgi:hypothetical protein